MGALILAAALSHGLAQRAKLDLIENRQFQENADLYEERAIDFLNQCNSWSSKNTRAIMDRSMELMGGRSVIELSILSQSLKFIATQTMQDFLDSIWLGKPQYFFLLKYFVFP